MSLCGGAMTPNLRGRIVLLEDVNERGYQVDRFLHSLEESGAFKGARAVVFGDFRGGAEVDGRSWAEEAMRLFASRVRCPVFGGAPVGHGKRLPPLVVGAPAQISSTAPRRSVLEITR